MRAQGGGGVMRGSVMTSDGVPPSVIAICVSAGPDDLCAWHAAPAPAPPSPPPPTVAEDSPAPAEDDDSDEAL